MTTFVFVHGAFHGGWCWERVRPFLENQGHNVYAPDLPSHGKDAANPEDVSLDDYVERIGKTLQQIKEKVVLVGHSLGGITITQVGETYCERISQLVYLAAAIPAHGQCRADLIEGNEQSVLNDFRITSQNGKLYTVLPEGVKPAFYADCDDESIAWAQERLCPQPTIILQTPVSTTAQRWGKIPRAYIMCTEDKAILPASQRIMSQRHGCNPVISMNTSHSPFMSEPAELARHLMSISG